MNYMSTHSQYEAIKQMWWYQEAELNRLKRLHMPVHWWVIVWQKSKKWVECIKCGLIANKKNLESECVSSPKPREKK